MSDIDGDGGERSNGSEVVIVIVMSGGVMLKGRGWGKGVDGRVVDRVG